MCRGVALPLSGLVRDRIIKHQVDERMSNLNRDRAMFLAACGNISEAAKAFQEYANNVLGISNEVKLDQDKLKMLEEQTSKTLKVTPRE